ncbi:MAG TPA: hypothetical protein VGN11_05045 [Candidatus Baltobacteraceae bacterium]|jgi:hypothetical protein|nr:hypothetical protein [Candidatus Baltobacteraceae bacterium]
MLSRFVTVLAVSVFFVTTASFAATSPTPPPKPQGAEVAFVSSLQKDLMTRFATAGDAENAGYFRYTKEDKSGSISYANLAWTSGDPQHPSQLWYDVNGKLLGADFSEPKTDAPPQLWGVSPQRWGTIRAHIHYVLSAADGKETYGATSAAKFIAAGGNAGAPKAETLVKMGVVKDESSVKHVFLFPAIWDLQVWVKQNPNGAFAEMNPLVIPSATAGKPDM